MRSAFFIPLDSHTEGRGDRLDHVLQRIIVFTDVIQPYIDQFFSQNADKRTARLTENQLEDRVRGIGMATFVQYIEYFLDQYFSDDQIVELLIQNRKDPQASARARVMNFRVIIGAHRINDALKIAKASKTRKKWIEKATILLEKDLDNRSAV